MFRSMWMNVRYVSKTNQNSHTPLVYYNHCRFQSKNGTVSMDFITGLPKYLGKDCIYVVVDILTKFAHLYSDTSSFIAAHVAELFSEKYSDCMGSPRALWVIEMVDSWVLFGKKFSDWWALSRLQIQATIPKLMDKQRGRINGWKGTSETMWENNKKLGQNGYTWVSFATTPPFTCQ